MKLPTIKMEWLLWGAGLGLVLLFVNGLRDRNGDGTADGIAAGLGYDLGRLPFDVLGGVTGGAVDGVRDMVWDMDKCTQAHAEGSILGILWHCPPTRTFDNVAGL